MYDGNDVWQLEAEQGIGLRAVVNALPYSGLDPQQGIGQRAVVNALPYMGLDPQHGIGLRAVVKGEGSGR